MDEVCRHLTILLTVFAAFLVTEQDLVILTSQFKKGKGSKSRNYIFLTLDWLCPFPFPAQ